MTNDYMPPPTDLKRRSIVWCYLRDSGGDSQEQSVPQQRLEISAYCEQYDLILVHTFADVAKSGKDVVGRDQFYDMIAMARDTKPDGVLIWNFARFSRALTDANYYKAALRKDGIIIHSLTDPIPEGPYGFVVETIIDIANDEKRRQNSRDVKRSLRQLVAQGYSAGGTPPRGYIAETTIIGYKRDGSPRRASKWIPDPDLWEYTKLAWIMRSKNASYREITDTTNGELYTNKTSWKSFFQNVSYLGVGKCGDFRVENHHPAAVDQATWDAVQGVQMARAKPSSEKHPRRYGSAYLLSGIAFCIHCGTAMNVKVSGEWKAYVCGKRTSKTRGSAKCVGRYVNLQRANRAVFDTVYNRILTPYFFMSLLHKLSAKVSDSTRFQDKLAKLEMQLLEKEKAIQNLLDMVELYGAKEVVGTRIRELERDKRQILDGINSLEAQIALVSQLELSTNELSKLLHHWKIQAIAPETYDSLESQRRFLMGFVQKIELGFDRAVIWYTYPIDPADTVLDKIVSVEILLSD